VTLVVFGFGSIFQIDNAFLVSFSHTKPFVKCVSPLSAGIICGLCWSGFRNERITRARIYRNENFLAEFWNFLELRSINCETRKAICTRDASSAVRLLCLRLVRWVQCAVVCTRMRMKRCVRCARPGLNEWFRPESRRWRWCAAVQDCVLLKFWHHKWHIFRVLLILYTILLNKVTQDLWRYTAQTLKGLVTCIQNKRKLPNLTLYNASQIIKKVVLSTFQTNKVLHYIQFAWFVATWIEWGFCRPTSIVMTALL